MVKVLGNAGKGKKRRTILLSLSEPVDAGIWGALLGCCEMHGNATLAETILHNLFGNQPEEHSYLVLLSKIYAINGRWDDVEKVRDDLTDRGAKKVTAFLQDVSRRKMAVLPVAAVRSLRVSLRVTPVSNPPPPVSDAAPSP